MQDIRRRRNLPQIVDRRDGWFVVFCMMLFGVYPRHHAQHNALVSGPMRFNIGFFVYVGIPCFIAFLILLALINR